MIKLGNLLSASLCNELQFWWLVFFLLSSYGMVMFQGKPFANLCVLNQMVQQQA